MLLRVGGGYRACTCNAHAHGMITCMGMIMCMLWRLVLLFGAIGWCSTRVCATLISPLRAWSLYDYGMQSTPNDPIWARSMSTHTSMQVRATLQGAGGGHTDEQPLALFSHFCSYDPLCDAIELPLGTATTPLICAQKSGLSGVRAPLACAAGSIHGSWGSSGNRRRM